MLSLFLYFFMHKLHFTIGLYTAHVHQVLKVGEDKSLFDFKQSFGAARGIHLDSLMKVM